MPTTLTLPRCFGRRCASSPVSQTEPHMRDGTKASQSKDQPCARLAGMGGDCAGMWRDAHRFV
eukprot:2585854-Rhodomonas_salina.1